MTIDKPHALHKGEKLIQTRQNTPSELAASIPSYISVDMPQQHAEFYAGLPYLPLATLDDQGRPWASLLVTKSKEDPKVGVHVSEQGEMDIIAESNPYDPFVRALQREPSAAPTDRQLFAGVGVDFTNRRRNKLAGTIKSASVDFAGKIHLSLTSDQHLGNCPKYITVRSLEHFSRDAEVVLDSLDELQSPLPETSKALVNRASTVFLATKHTPEGEEHSDHKDMGLNHRGGARGFVRVYEEVEDGKTITYIVLPDHSGNRFYQSLGNIETDKQVGLVFPDFATGDVLHITGFATNLFDERAAAIMPRTNLLTLIKVTGAVFVQNGLNLKLISEEEYSPYNPPVKYLRRELEQMGRPTKTNTVSKDPITATLVSVQRRSDTISTFTFDLSKPVGAPLPGGFGIFDFSRVLDFGYSHMNEANPQMVNEDYVRTWTLSNASTFDAGKNRFSPTNQVSVTVKRKQGGLMSNFLHDHAAKSEKTPEQSITAEFKGIGSAFSCFDEKLDGVFPTVPPRMLWIAGGVGVTPFMSMWEGIVNLTKATSETAEGLSTDIVMLFSGRDDDIGLAKHFLATIGSLPKGLSMRVLVFQSSGDNPSEGELVFDTLSSECSDAPLKVEQRRLRKSDLEMVESLHDRDIFVCGPDTFMQWTEQTLSELGVDNSRVHKESFLF